MKSLLVLLALGLGTAVTACGGSSSTDNAATRVASSAPTAPTSSATPPPDTTSPPAPGPESVRVPVQKPTRRDLEKYDRDEDDYIHVPDDTNPFPPGYADASPGDRQAVTALVKRYYSTALSGNGLGGCLLIDRKFLMAIPLDYGKLGPPFLRHAAHTCRAVMSALFEHEHRKLVSEVPQLEVVRVGVNGSQGVAIMRLGRLHERSISLLREGSTWKIGSVLDGELE